MSEVLSFAEESCFSGDTFRSIRREIQFVLQGYGKQLGGKSVKLEFTSDFGLYYDYEDTVLLSILEGLDPAVKWGWYIYHKKMDQSAIEIINPDTNKVVGSIAIRAASRSKLSGEPSCANVMSWAAVQEWKSERAKRVEEPAEHGGE